MLFISKYSIDGIDGVMRPYRQGRTAKKPAV